MQMIDKFGLEECGKLKWSRLGTRAEKLKHCYNIMSDDGLFKQRMDDTNFDVFRNIFTLLFVTKEAQTWLLSLQLDYEMENSRDDDISSLLRKYFQNKLAWGSTYSVKDFF